MEQVKLVLILSGRGSDAASILATHQEGKIPEVDEIILISTVEGAGECVKKFISIKMKVIDYEATTYDNSLYFDNQVKLFLQENHIELVFAVGCIHLLPILTGIDGYNIHPADIEEHGGNTMYGLAVHQHALNSIMDQIKRGRGNVNTQFFTKIVIHKIGKEYDKGNIFKIINIPIPTEIVLALHKKIATIEEAAKNLQKHVIQFEHIELPSAVRSAARIILERKEGKGV
ncbi:hypothetical protein ACFL23_00520 [Patescibacteria group bacterium]